MQILPSQPGKKKEEWIVTQVVFKTHKLFYRQKWGRKPNQKKHPTVCTLHDLLPSPILCRATAFN